MKQAEDIVLPLNHVGGDIFEADGCCIARLGSRPMDADLADLFTTSLNSYERQREGIRELLKYAGHDEGCTPLTDSRCDCGFDATLAHAKELLK